MHDHSETGKRYCPLMREWCTKGWTPAMGGDKEGFPVEGACRAWQAVATFDPVKNQVREIHDCSLFGWPTDLMAEIAKEISQGTASTDKVATEIRGRAIILKGTRDLLKEPPPPPQIGSPETNGAPRPD